MIKGKLILLGGFVIQTLSTLAITQTIPNPNSVKIGNKNVEFEIHNIYGLNSEYAEFSPVLFNGEFVFVSDRYYDFRNLGEDNWENNKHINIFKAEIEYNNADSVVFDKINIYDRVFMEDDHSGPICFSSDGKLAIFTKVSHRDARKSGFEEKKGLLAKTSTKPQLYQAVYEDGKWGKVEKLNFVKVNKTYGHPTLSADGNTLYFVSDEFGGKGGKDLFKVEMTTTGWGEPKALNALNTTGDELFPTIVGNDLYFSSNGREGEGGLDLYISTFKNGEWSEPVNLGTTINSPADDFGIVFNNDKMSGYFTSNRESGLGSDDIYHFDKIETVTVEDNSIAGQFTYKLLKDKNPAGIEVMLLDEDGNLVATTKTEPDGSFNFRNLQSDQRYTIKLSEDSDDIELTLFGQGDDAFLLANKEGEFVFRKLSPENVGTMALMDEESIDPMTREGAINGQFVYSKLQNSASGLEVLLLDEDGNIVQRTMTDANGNFSFKKLSADKNYTIKTMEYNDDLELYIYNNNDKVTATLASDENGLFVYRKLDADYAGNLENLKLDEEQLEFEDRTQMVSGEFKYRNLNEPMNVVAYEIYDGDLTLLKSAETNDNSYFRHFNIPDVEKLLFKIDGKKYNEDVDLIILDRNRELVIQLDKNDDGYFVYQKLKDGSDLLTEEEILASLRDKDGLAGQFLYKKLKSDDGILSYEIFDEDGNLVKRGQTDNHGIFHEPDLDKNANFKFRVLEADENTKLRMYSEEEGELVILDKANDGYFKFDKLSDEGTSMNTETEENNDMLVRYNQGKLISNLFYAHNIYKLSAENKAKMNELVVFLNNNQDAKIIVSSHASLIGTNEYNDKLSERRMREVVTYLLEAGISEDRFKGQYFGEDNPLVDCAKQDCDKNDIKQNRRTEISVVK